MIIYSLNNCNDQLEYSIQLQRIQNYMNKEQCKIKPFVIYTKIQEAYPAHCSNLVNKQLGYDTIIQQEDIESIKIKNSICSVRPNSQLFKRFSRNFLANMKNQVDQLILFTSANAQSRIETSIGLQTNPGIFLIIGLTFLDQKYKEPYHKCEVEFSFLQFRQGQMYDLLCYTEQPLKPQRQSSTNKFTNFRQHWAKATTFNQFIKFFKIALFNNKERDFKTENKNIKYRSTFIMKIRSKIYSFQNEIIKEHETVLIDYQPNCQKDNLVNAKQKNKNILQYFLIEMNNSNPSNKHIHYHLVQQSSLLLLLKKFLPKSRQIKDQSSYQPFTSSQVMFINSFPAQRQSFAQNYAYLENIRTFFNEDWEVKIQLKTKKDIKFNHQFIQNHLKSISNGVCLNTYNSLRSFNSYKQHLANEIKKEKQVIKQFKRIISLLLREKLELQFLKNEILAYEYKLIGSCIKSDHFKDFYNAKSYLQLQRQVKIKTEVIKQDIKTKLRVIQNIEKKYQILYKKQIDTRCKNVSQPPQNTPFSNININSSVNSLNHTKHSSWMNNSSISKFKKLTIFKGEQSQKQQMKNLSFYLYGYMNNLWDNICQNDQRTVSSAVSLQTQIYHQEQHLFSLMDQFNQDIATINETDIMYEQENNIYNNNDIALFRSLNFLGMLGPKKKAGEVEIGKRLMIKNKQRQVPIQKHKKNTKLPSISKHIVITGQIKISQMLSNPGQQSQPCLIKSELNLIS